MAVFILLLAMQTGCNMSGSKKDAKTEYVQAKELENKGQQFRHEGNTDSAIFYFDKSLVLYKELASLVSLANDTLYGQNICRVSLYKSFLLDTLKKPKMEIPVLLEALKWAKICRSPNATRIAEEYLGFSYINLGLDASATRSEHDSLFKKAAMWMEAECSNYDSLKLDKTSDALEAYNNTRNIFKELKDTAGEHYYEIKAEKAYDAIHGLTRISGYPDVKHK